MKNIDNQRLWLKDKEDMLQFFGFSNYKQLNYLSFGKNSRSNRIYSKKRILKRDGSYRELLIPGKRLKIAQKHILKHILGYGIQKKLLQNVCGFIQGKSIYNNASFHLGKEQLIKIDIKNFFPTISQNRIYGMFRKIFEYDHIVSSYLSGLCSYENQLPQGAPTSPAISNIIASNLDKRIMSYLSKIDTSISYSRYADDITIGLGKLNGININRLVQKVFSVIEEEGFMVNYNKIKNIKSGSSMKITGLTINSGTVGVGRRKYKYVRAIVFNIKKNGRVKEKEKYVEINRIENISIEKFKNIIHGHINYIHMINPKLGEKLKYDLSNVLFG